MKNLILSVLAVILAVFVIETVSADQGILVASETKQPNVEPISWKIRHGENLTRISERYGLKVEDLLNANKDNLAIVSRDKILAGYKIAIPLGMVPQVQSYERERANSLVKAIDIARLENTKKNSLLNNLVIYGMAALILLLIVMFVARNSILKDLQNAREDKAHLRDKLWASEDKATSLEKEKAYLVEKLSNAQTQLINAQQHIQQQIVELNLEISKLRLERSSLFIRLANKISVGDNVSVLSKESGKIDLKVLKVELENDVTEIYVECTAKKPNCLSNKAHNLKWKNALSHLNAHSTNVE